MAAVALTLAALLGADARGPQHPRSPQQQAERRGPAAPDSRLLAFGPAGSRARRLRGGGDEAAAGSNLAPAAPPVDALREERTRCSPDRDGWYPHAYPVVNESIRVCVQQVQGCGDCLFHAIAVGEVHAKRGEHIGMYDASLEKRVAELRKVRARAPSACPARGLHGGPRLSPRARRPHPAQLAVETLESHDEKPLLMEDGEHINGGELVETVAEQYGLKPREYLELMRQPRVWGGGPEIIALVTAIGHPIHVYEPVCANNGTEIHLVLSGKYGSPKYDAAGAIHVLAADDRFPLCGPTEFKLHGEGGNHFLALIPAGGEAAGSNPDREG